MKRVLRQESVTHKSEDIKPNQNRNHRIYLVERRNIMLDEKYTTKYNDIINLPHPTSSKHPRMSLHDRAAQFSPFAALTGYDSAIKETSRLTDTKIELDEDAKVRLDEQLQFIKNNLGEEIEVTFTYFVPDEKKSGGEYISHTGIVRKIDEYNRNVIMQDKTIIPIEYISNIEIGLK